jgi:hypothetical protein
MEKTVKFSGFYRDLPDDVLERLARFERATLLFRAECSAVELRAPVFNPVQIGFRIQPTIRMCSAVPTSAMTVPTSWISMMRKAARAVRAANRMRRKPPMTIYLALLVSLIGLFMYVLSVNPKLSEIGRLMFFAGLLAFLLGDNGALAQLRR